MIFKRFLTWLVAGLIACQPALALTAAQKIVVLNGIQSWSIPGSSADLFFSRNAGSCSISRIAQPCTNLVAVSRALQEACTWADGHINFTPSNTGCYTNLGFGSTWQTSTNEALYARDMTQTAWVKVNVTAALTATGVDNSANSASLLTAGAANGTVLQTFSLTSQAEIYSVYLERVTGTGNIQITENNGSTWTTATSAICTGPGGVASNLLTTAYVRCSVEATLANPIIGIRIVTNGDAVNVDFNQDEENVFATPPILTTTVAVNRPADVITAKGALLTALLNAEAVRSVTNNVNVPSGISSFIAGYTGTNNGNNSYLNNGGTPNVITSVNAGNSATALPGAGSFSGLLKSAFNFGTGTIATISNGSSLVSASQAWSGFSAVHIGSNAAGGQPLNGYLLRFTAGPIFGQFNNLTTGSNPQ